MNNKGKVPPSSIESEKRVLSACMHGDFLKIHSFIKSGADFYKESHQRLFDAFVKIQSEGKEITRLQLGRTLKDEMESIGGFAYIEKVFEVPYNKIDVSNDAMYIIETSLAREGIKSCTAIINELLENKDVFKTIDKINEFQTTVLNKVSTLKTFDFNKEKDEVIKDVYDRFLGKGQQAVSTMIRKIDNVLGGFQKKSLNILGGRPGAGKSAIAIQLLHNFSIKQDHTSLLFSLEMSNAANIRRLLANHISCYGINMTNFEIAKGFVGNEPKLNQFINSATKFTTDRILLYDNIYTIQDIRTKSIELVKNKNVDVIIIDHLHIIQTDTPGTDIAKLTEISGKLKMLAKECDVPVICLAQLNRGVESRDDKMPMLSDLRGSGSIEQDSDSVCFFYRPFYYDDTADEFDMEYSVAKNRDGGCERFHLYTNIKNSTFLDEAPSYNNDVLKTVEVTF